MKLHQLRALAEVAKAGSIQRAAHAMNLSQPALSRSIRELERQMGVALLNRSLTGTTLTPFGAILAKRYHAIRREIDHAREEVEWLKGATGGRLLVGTSPPVAGIGIASVFADFHQRRPAVQLEVLELRPAQIFDTIRSGILDFGILHHHGGVDTAGLQCETIASFPTFLAVGGTPASPPATVQALWSHQWMTGDLSDYPHGYVAALSARLARDLPERIFRCTSMAMYFELAEQPGIVSHWADTANPHLDAKIETGALTKLDPAVDLPTMRIDLVYKDEDLLSPGGAHLVRMIRSSLG